MTSQNVFSEKGLLFQILILEEVHTSIMLYIYLFIHRMYFFLMYIYPLFNQKGPIEIQYLFCQEKKLKKKN